MIKCYFEDKGEGLLRHVTADAIVTQGSRILLVKRAAHLSHGNKYCLPGGFLNRDETVVEGVKREVLEETGYESKDVTLFKITDNPHRKGEDRQNVAFVFIIEAGNKVSEPDNEVKEVEWFKIDQLPKEEEFAFDHFDNIKLYLKHQSQPFSLPLVGRI